MEHAMKSTRTKSPKPQLVTSLYLAFYIAHFYTATHFMAIGQFASRPMKKNIGWNVGKEFSILLIFLSVARLDVAVVDIGQPADWVKVNVQKTVSCGVCFNEKHLK